MYIYRLTHHGILAAESGVIEDSGGPVGMFDATYPGAYTSHFFEEQLEQEIRRATRYRNPLSLLLISLDHYEAVEQQVGKSTMASLFKNIVTVIKELLRACDVIAIYREGTVSALLPATSPNGCAVVAERIRAQVSETVTLSEGSPVTVTIGTVSMPDSADQGSRDTTTPPFENARQMMQTAIEQLQTAQQAGGNRVQGR